MRFWKLGVGIAIGCFSRAIAAQCYNVDCNLSGVHPALGGGTPSIFFGGAANQPGFWDTFEAQGQPPKQLKNVSGELTSVVLNGWGWTSGLGYNQPLNTGDYCLLLNDGCHVPSTNYYQFTGMALGSYRIFTYAVRPPLDGATIAPVTIESSTTPNPQIATGPMPGNQLIQGITHTVHEVPILNGTMIIRADKVPNQLGFLINGFQIVQLSAYVAPSSYTVTQGLNFGGSLSSILTSDDQRTSILNDEFDTNGEFEFTSTLPAGTVSQLKFKFEGRASRSDLSQFLKMRSYTTGQYTNVNTQTATLADSIAEGSITSGANNYFSASREVKAKATWIPQLDVDAMDGWVEGCDQAMWEMVF